MAEKKGFLYRLTMGKDDNPDYDVSRLPGTRWAVFKDVLTQRFGALVKINLLMLLFCLPAIAWMGYCYIVSNFVEGNIPYTGNLGFGMQAVADAVLLGKYNNFSMTIVQFGIFIPCLMVASIGFAGGFHTLKLLVWGEGISVASTFFRGIKNNILPFLWSTLIIGGGIMLVAFNFSSMGLFNDGGFLGTMAIVSSILLLVLLMFMALYMFTQSVTYKIKFFGLVKNSFLLSIGMIFQNIFFVGITAIPVILAMVLPTIVSMFFLFFYLICGMSITVLIWTVYSQYVFDKFINDRVEGAIKDRGVYRRSKEQIEQKRVEAIARRKKSANTRFANPKKKKIISSVEEGKNFTPLVTTFSRNDLQKLAAEKKAVKEEIDDEYEISIADDIADEDDPVLSPVAEVSAAPAADTDVFVAEEGPETTQEEPRQKKPKPEQPKPAAATLKAQAKPGQGGGASHKKGGK